MCEAIQILQSFRNSDRIAQYLEGKVTEQCKASSPSPPETSLESALQSHGLQRMSWASSSTRKSEGRFVYKGMVFESFPDLSGQVLLPVACRISGNLYVSKPCNDLE